jgi:opacity protein-like surface antigen
MRIGRILVVAVMMVVFTASASALATDSEAAKEALKKGSWSLQFGVGQNFTLTQFQGATLSIKRHCSPNSALRAGVTTNFSHNVEKDLRNASEFDVNKSDVNVSLEYLRYITPGRRVTAFAGSGPSFGFSRQKQEVLHRSVATSSNRIESTEWSLGANLLFGAEWFVTHGIALFAEYDISFGYTSKVNKASSSGDGLTGQTESFGYSLISRGVRMGLSVYL